MSEPSERALVERYFDAFNRHDLEGVVACFRPDAVVVGSDGRRYDGLAAVRAMYAEQFALTPDGRCDLTAIVAGDGRGAAESSFYGTTARSGRAVRAIGVELFEFVDGRIKEIRDHHRRVNAGDV